MSEKKEIKCSFYTWREHSLGGVSSPEKNGLREVSGSQEGETLLVGLPVGDVDVVAGRLFLSVAIGWDQVQSNRSVTLQRVKPNKTTEGSNDSGVTG